jgi:hypothetical protein
MAPAKRPSRLSSACRSGRPLGVCCYRRRRFHGSSGAAGGVAGWSKQLPALAFEGWSAVWWVEPGGAVGIITDGHRPATFMNLVMMVAAEQVEMVGFGFAVVFKPVQAVMGFGVGGWPVTAGPGAATVTGDQEMAEAGGNGAGPATEIQHFGVGAVDGGDHPAVTRHPAGSRRR